jgi:endonuclease-3
MAKRAKTKINRQRARERVKQILPVLRRHYPQARTALDYGNPLQLLIATILSAQCTDKRVNEVTKDLFKKYKTAADWVDADIAQIENDIRSTGFYKNKAKSIKNSCRVIEKEYGGQVPGNMVELVKLPGVGRKTANVILGNAFGTPGITCDTHVIRLSRRLQLSANTHDAVKLEFDLAEIVPRKDWTLFSNLLISHGRNVCKARKPDCDNCTIDRYCPAAHKPNLW